MTTHRPLHVLVLCTGNSARSILGEALFNHLGQGRIRAFSAGSRPSGAVNPVAIETLRKHDVPIPDDLRSKSWAEFSSPNAPAIDLVCTVCASAAGESCPIWPGTPVTVHWAIDDPAHVEPMEARRSAFEQAYQALEKRIRALLSLDLEYLPPTELARAAQQIHKDTP